jgi:formiminoglutamase
VHAVQLELAMRGYVDEPTTELRESDWPPAYDATRAAKLVVTLRSGLNACLSYAAPARAKSARPARR